MNELGKPHDFLETVRYTPWPTFKALEKPLDREIELGMAEFIKERHSPQEWDAFFAYYHFGPRKRAWCRALGLLYGILGIL